MERKTRSILWRRLQEINVGSIVTCCSIGMLILGLFMAVLIVLPFASALLGTELLPTQVLGAILLLTFSGLIGRSVLAILGY